MLKDKISTDENVISLRKQLYEITYDMKFKRCKSMAQIIKTTLEFIKRNYESVNTKKDFVF